MDESNKEENEIDVDKPFLKEDYGRGNHKELLKEM